MAIHVAKYYIIFSLFAGLILCIFPKNVSAQSCGILKETINELVLPKLGTYSLWDLVNGLENMDESFHDVLMLNERDVILAGEQKNRLLVRPYIVKMNRRGRVLWSWMDKNQLGLSRPISIKQLVAKKDGFLAVGQIYKDKLPHAIWVGHFNENGKKTKEHIFAEKSRQLTYAGLTKSPDKKGWLLGVTENHISKEETLNRPHAKFILLDQNFKRKLSRSFLPGPANRIFAVEKYKTKANEMFYIAVGEINDGYDRSAGLVLRLDEQANIVWQKTYPRGEALRFRDVAITEDQGVIVVGEADPIGEQMPLAAVAMKLSTLNGDEIWQRYYKREDMSYSVQDVFTVPDNRSFLLLHGETDKSSDIQPHARVIMLNPRGQIMGRAVSYTAGKEVTPHVMKMGKSERLIIAGRTTKDVSDEDDANKRKKLTKQGWFIVGEAIGLYEDPCIPKERKF